MFGSKRRTGPPPEVVDALNYHPLASEEYRWSQRGGDGTFMITSHRLFAATVGGAPRSWYLQDIATARMVRQQVGGALREFVELTFRTTPEQVTLGPIDRYDWFFNHVSEATARPIRLELM